MMFTESLYCKSNPSIMKHWRQLNVDNRSVKLICTAFYGQCPIISSILTGNYCCEIVCVLYVCQRKASHEEGKNCHFFLKFILRIAFPTFY